MNKQSLRVLVVEDDADDFLLTRDLLGEMREFDCRIERADSYGAARRAIAATAFDLCLIDYRLGERTGLELLREAAGVRAPMILLTGEDDCALDIEAMRAGAADYLFKGEMKAALLERSVRYAIERKRAENAVRESEERYRLLVEQSPDMIAIHYGGRFLYVNAAGAELLGAPSAHDLIGKPILEVIHPDYRDSDLSWTAGNGMGEKTPLAEQKLVRLDGRTVDVETTAIPTVYRNEPATQVLIKDITERRRAEKALFESEERLRQSQKMEAIGTLTGGVAHDFNNLLMAISGNSQLIRRRLAPDDPVLLQLDEIDKASSRAALLTRQLLAFSRRQHLERAAINLNDSVTGIVKLLDRIIGADVRIFVKTEDSLPMVFADAAQIEQVLMNLAVNARDAMPEGGDIIIETSDTLLGEDIRTLYPYVEPGRYVQITVADTGSGMDEQTIERIFEPFYTTKEVGKGTGLGLSMAYGIVKQHDGYIDVASRTGRGTTFRILLPVAKSESPQKNDNLKQARQPTGGTETILVAEDDEQVRDLIRNALEELGYTVLVTENGERAVETFRQNRERVNILLLDIVMPTMSGSEAYEKIREMDKHVPVIFATGYSAEVVQNRFVEQNPVIEKSGAPVIQKPYGLDVLARCIRRLLDDSKSG